MISKELSLVVEAHSKIHKGTDTEYQVIQTVNTTLDQKGQRK